MLNKDNIINLKFKFMNNIFKQIISIYKNLKKLPLIHKIFIILLILVFGSIIINNFGNNNNNNIENFSNSILDKPKYFESKKNQDIYDDFYSEYYDGIFHNKEKTAFEIGKISNLGKKQQAKILDVGCGTGNEVNELTNKNLEVIGLDNSKHMIEKAESKYPNCEFIKGDILNNGLFEYNSFTHILCLGRTIYLIDKKNKFFENCYSLLQEGGYLIVNLVERDKYKPYASTNKSKTLYDPEKYGKQITQMIVKFSKNTEFLSNYKKNDDHSLNNDLPYANYIEKFQNFDTNSIRKNEIDLYMPTLEEIENIAKSKGFDLYKKISMDKINFNNEYLNLFKK